MVERRIHTAMFHNGSYLEAGSIIDVPEDFPVPMKTVEHGHDIVDLTPESPTNGTRVAGRVSDVPLWSTPGKDGAAPVPNKAETAMGGGTLKMADETRLVELNKRGGDLSEDEVAERDALRQQIATSRNPTGNPPFKALAAQNAHQAEGIATGTNATPIAVDGRDHFTIAPPSEPAVVPGKLADAAAQGSRESVDLAEHETDHESEQHDDAPKPLSDDEKHRLEDLETKPHLSLEECGEMNGLKSRKIAKLEDEVEQKA